MEKIFVRWSEFPEIIRAIKEIIIEENKLTTEEINRLTYQDEKDRINIFLDGKFIFYSEIK